MQYGNKIRDGWACRISSEADTMERISGSPSLRCCRQRDTGSRVPDWIGMPVEIVGGDICFNDSGDKRDRQHA